MRRLLMVFMALLLMIPLTALAAGEPERPAPRPAVGGNLVFTWSTLPETLAYLYDPHSYSREMTSYIFGPGLLRYGPDNRVEPALAESLPELSEDKRTYTFALRRNVRFHDGAELTAHDFKFTYDLHLNPDHKGYRLGGNELIESIVVHNPYSLSITLSEPNALFLANGLVFEPPLPRHLLSHIAAHEMSQAEFWEEPIGVGPFRFAGFEPGEYVHLQRNPSYWEAKINPAVGPWLEELLIIAADGDDAAYAMAQGKISFLDPVSARHMEFFQTQGTEVLQFHQWHWPQTELLRLNTDRYPTSLPEVRHALAAALDRETMVSEGVVGPAGILNGLIPVGHAAHNPEVPEISFSLEAADQLLRSVGYGKGTDGMYRKDGELLTLHITGGGNILAERIMEQWRQAGIDVKYRQLSFMELMDAYAAGDYHVLFVFAQPFTRELASAFRQYHSGEIPTQTGGSRMGTNRSFYRNEDVDRLLEMLPATHSWEERVAIYQELELFILADMPVIPLYQAYAVNATWKDYQGVVVVEGRGYGFFERWYVYEQND